MTNPISPKIAAKLDAVILKARKHREHVQDCRICQEAETNAERGHGDGKPGYLYYCERGLKLHREWRKDMDNYLQFKEKISIN